MVHVEGFADEREAGGCFTITVKGKQDPGSPSPDIIVEL
jgi:hypothetical protein